MWDVGELSFTKGVRECGIVRRGDHRSPDKAIRCRVKKDVGVLFRTNGILFILATNGRPYAKYCFATPQSTALTAPLEVSRESLSLRRGV